MAQSPYVYKIKSQYGLCLTATKTDGSDITVGDCRNGTLWAKLGIDADCMIRSQYNNCLAVTVKNQIITGDCGSHSYTQWSIVKIDHSDVDSLIQSYYDPQKGLYPQFYPPKGLCLTANSIGSKVTAETCDKPGTVWKVILDTSFKLAQDFDVTNKFDTTPTTINTSPNILHDNHAAYEEKLGEDTEATQQSSPAFTAACILGSVALISLALVGYNHCYSEKITYDPIP